MKTFNKKLFLLSEIDFQYKNVKASQQNQTGYVMSHRLNYEFTQGVIPFITFDRNNLNPSDPKVERNAYGLGLQIFPRPHIEVFSSWQREITISGFF